MIRVRIADDQVLVRGRFPADPRHPVEVVPLSAGVDLSAYRIVQEALTNTLKHARAVRARVLVRYRGLRPALRMPGPA